MGGIVAFSKICVSPGRDTAGSAERPATHDCVSPGVTAQQSPPPFFFVRVACLGLQKTQSRRLPLVSSVAVAAIPGGAVGARGRAAAWVATRAVAWAGGGGLGLGATLAWAAGSPARRDGVAGGAVRRRLGFPAVVVGRWCGLALVRRLRLVSTPRRWPAGVGASRRRPAVP